MLGSFRISLFRRVVERYMSEICGNRYRMKMKLFFV